MAKPSSRTLLTSTLSPVFFTSLFLFSFLSGNVPLNWLRNILFNPLSLSPAYSLSSSLGCSFFFLVFFPPAFPTLHIRISSCYCKLLFPVEEQPGFAKAPVCGRSMRSEGPLTMNSLNFSATPPEPRTLFLSCASSRASFSRPQKFRLASFCVFNTLCPDKSSVYF